MANKVKFNIYDVYYATRTESGGTVTYGTPTALKGAVSISLEAQGDRKPFYADGIEYYVTQGNTGYEGNLVVAMIPDAFRQTILGEVIDTNNNLFEDATAEPVHFALSFTVDGNEGAIKFWFYDCVASRPSTSAETNTESRDPQTDTVSITAIPCSVTGYVRCKSTATTSEADLAAWNNAVVEHA